LRLDACPTMKWRHLSRLNEGMSRKSDHLSRTSEDSSPNFEISWPIRYQFCRIYFWKRKRAKSIAELFLANNYWLEFL
jgi:hypothetical protein